MTTLMPRFAALLTLLSALPLLAAGPAAAASPAKPEKTMNTNLENLELRYLEWRVESGPDMPRALVKHPWRNLSASVMHGRLNIHLGEGAPSLTWYGAPDPAELKNIKALADRLLREHGKPWPGGMERNAFDDLKRDDRKDRCAWKLIAMYNEPGGRDIVREISFQGVDRGDNPERLAFETPLAAHIEKLVRRLHETAPKTPRSLLYFGPDGASYSLNVEDDGRARVSRRIRGKGEEESEVDPAVIAQVADIARKHRIDAQHGFAPPGWDRKQPGAFDFSLHYDTGQDVWFHGLRGSANPAAEPPGFPAFERELLSALDTALDGPNGPAAAAAGPKTARQGLKRLEFSEGGMSYDSHIRFTVGTRREAGRDVFRLMRRQGDAVAECALSDADLAALEALLVKHRILSWNGFRGTAKNVLDGDSFGLSLEYADGRKADASGYMRFPQGYGAARDEIWGFLDGVLKRSGAQTRRMRR